MDGCGVAPGPEAPAPGPAADAAEAALRTDPRLLQDPRRLGALRVELVAGLGRAAAERALRQAGFVQALRDLGRLLAGGWSGGPGAPAPAGCDARVPFDLRSRARGPGLELEGTWTEGTEAQGVLGAEGPASGPACATSAGYASGWLSGVLGEDVVAVEEACAAAGAPACRFRVRRARDWHDGPGGAVAADLDPEALRARVEEEALRAAGSADPTDGGGVDPGLPVVHVWGPVMVVPFAGARDSISALDLMVRDDCARDVSVVVLDLGGAVLDAGTAALAVEEVLDAIERRGADAVLAGISPASAPVVAHLQARHLLLHAELPRAIAAAFQIAEAQRRVY